MSTLLTQTARAAAGIVTDTTCSNHGRIDFAYSVDRQSYHGTGVASACGISHCSQDAVGEAVHVTYSSKRPQLAICERLENERTNANASIIWMAVLAASMAYGVYRRMRST